MPEDRFERGIKRGSALFGETFTRGIVEEYREWDPEWAELFMHFVYGGMYDREVIPPKWRQLITVAACVCLNAPSNLENHAKAAIRMGATKEEVQEVILQMSVYAGMPYTLMAMRHFRKFIKDWTPEVDVTPYSERE